LPRLIERRSQPRRRRDDDDRVGDLCGRPRRRGSPVRSVKNEAVVGRGQPGENIVERFAADSPPDGMTSRLVERSRRITSTKLALPAKRSARLGISTRSESLRDDDVGEPVLRGAEIDEKRGDLRGKTPRRLERC
jgi:hypothetical protein